VLEESTLGLNKTSTLPGSREETVVCPKGLAQRALEPAASWW